MSDEILRLSDIRKTYCKGELLILDGVNLSIFPGECVAIVGKSGTGKSTILHVAGLLDGADRGKVEILGQNMTECTDKEQSYARNRTIGFIFQQDVLLSDFTALENVKLPALIANRSEKDADATARRLLAEVGLADRMSHKPRQLSGGERQRVAIARSLVNNPEILLADEPTGSLDQDNAALIEEKLIEMVRSKGKSLLLVTHNLDFAKKCDRILQLKDRVLKQEV